MNNTFVMKWPSLNKSVTCQKIEHNQHIFDWWEAQLPLRALQGNIVVAGWGLLAVSVPLRNRVNWVPGTEVVEGLLKQKEGRLNIFMPMGSYTGIFFKYGEFTEPMKYATFAEVQEADLPIIREVGEVLWRSAVKTKEIYNVEYVKAEGK